MPQQQRRDDAGDPEQDQVGLAEVAALEARRPHDLADVERRAHADQHEHREHVDEECEPALVAEPWQRGALVHRADHRHHDGREEHDETPEDEGVHHSRAEPLQDLLLPDRDHGLLADALGDVVEALGRPAQAHDPHEHARTPGEEARTYGQRGEQRDQPDGAYPAPAFRSAAVIAGITSCRSPITAYSAWEMIGASGSVLTAMIRFAPLQPAMCCVAPLMPQARYTSGAILVPVWPT